MPVDPYLIDDDAPELTRAQIEAMRPAAEALPPGLYSKLVENRPGTREAVVVHLDPDVAARLRADGPDWENRVGDILRKAVGL